MSINIWTTYITLDVVSGKYFFNIFLRMLQNEVDIGSWPITVWTKSQQTPVSKGLSFIIRHVSSLPQAYRGVVRKYKLHNSVSPASTCLHEGYTCNHHVNYSHRKYRKTLFTLNRIIMSHSYETGSCCNNFYTVVSSCPITNKYFSKIF